MTIPTGAQLSSDLYAYAGAVMADDLAGVQQALWALNPDELRLTALAAVMQVAGLIGVVAAYLDETPSTTLARIAGT